MSAEEGSKQGGGGGRGEKRRGEEKIWRGVGIHMASSRGGAGPASQPAKGALATTVNRNRYIHDLSLSSAPSLVLFLPSFFLLPALLAETPSRVSVVAATLLRVSLSRLPSPFDAPFEYKAWLSMPAKHFPFPFSTRFMST